MIFVFVAFFVGFYSAHASVLSSFKVPDGPHMTQVADKFEIVQRNGSHFTVYVPEGKHQELLNIAPQSELLEPNIRQQLKAQAGKSWNRYKTFEQVQEFLKEMALRNPTTVRLFTIGQSNQGRPIYAVKISDNVQVDEDEAELLLTAGTHGDEIITVEVLLALMAEITRKYGEGSEVDQFVNERELFFLPVVNPDGFTQRSRYSSGRDPNRAYPTASGRQRFHVECIKHVIKFFNERNFVGSMDFHAYGELVMYPFAETRAATPDESKFARLSSSMAQANRYRAGQISRILYGVSGSSSDYYYNKNGTMAFAIEIAQSKAPDLSQFAQIFEDARSMTWAFLRDGRYLK